MKLGKKTNKTEIEAERASKEPSERRSGKRRREPKPESRHLLLKRRMPKGIGRKVGFLSWQFFLLLLACLVLTLCTLLLSYSNFSSKIFKGYFECSLIFWVNFAIPTAICLLLFAVIGRAWIAFLLTAVICLGISIGNYYLIIIRNDPLQFEDLTCIREALAITDKQGYELNLSRNLIISILSCTAMTVLLAFLSRWRLRLNWWRIPVLAVAVFLGFQTCSLINDDEVYANTKYYKYIDTWSTTQIYVSRGVLYSFSRTIFSQSNPPKGYSEKETAADFAQYSDADLPADRKVDIIAIMRESYADLSDVPCTEGTIDFSCYDTYHALADESKIGYLITNGFGGNTKNAERCFLTGNYLLSEWRKPVNSYVWYLRGQGYETEGAHPFNGWFYNRRNVNRYLGFEHYVFREDGFEELENSSHPVEDSILYDRIWEMYQSRDTTKPYFHFSVTYEGHGPYHYRTNDYPGTNYVLAHRNTNDGIAMNNFLACAAKRDEELKVLVDRLRTCDSPVVLVTFGDHKATLGKDINNYTTAAYETFGMDLDLSTEEGFFNYYATEYLIWMNDAAKEILGVDPAGQTGPTISPCYLMNVLFDTLGWGKGPAFLQAMDEEMEVFPVMSTKGRVGVEGKLSTTIPGPLVKDYHRLEYLSYYWRTHSFYRTK